jgi:hypothetical protein
MTTAETAVEKIIIALNVVKLTTSPAHAARLAVDIRNRLYVTTGM